MSSMRQLQRFRRDCLCLASVFVKEHLPEWPWTPEQAETDLDLAIRADRGRMCAGQLRTWWETRRWRRRGEAGEGAGRD